MPWESDGEEEPDMPAFPSGIMKVRHGMLHSPEIDHRIRLQPDITFFGEKLSDEFDKALAEDRPLVDLLIVIGTSLKVSPVADIPSRFTLPSAYDGKALIVPCFT